MATDQGSGDPSPRNPELVAAHRHAEIVEALWRIGTGIEALNRTQEQISRQLADVVARVESALQYVVRAWQATQPAKPRR
jgi:hypothetical protein